MCGVVDCLLGLMMNNTKGEQPREGLFLAGAMNCFGEFSRLFLSLLELYQISRCLGVSLPSTLWWLALFIEAPGLSPNNEREGRQQLAILKGNI